MTLTEFKSDIYTRDVQLPDVSDTVFLSLLKRAIVNVRAELRDFEPDRFEEWLISQTSPVVYPANLVRNETVLFYPKDEYELPIGEQYISARGGSWYIEGFTEFNIKYQKDIIRHTAMSESLVFTTEQAQEILISEMMALINEYYEENEATPSVTNALTQSNRVK